MTVTPNHAKRRLAEGKLTLGIGATLLRGSAPSLLAKANGFDFLFIDMEHASTTLDDAARMASSALATGVTPIVRCCRDALHEGTRALDNGTLGIVVPHVDTADDARQMVAAYLYPPRGRRSITNQLPQTGYRLPMEDDTAFRTAIETLNRETLLVAMIESPDGVENADAIAAVDGIDVLWIGTNDLAAMLDAHNQARHPRVRAAFARVAEAARRHRKSWGMGGVADEAVLRDSYAMGARFILATDDFGAIMAGAATRAAQFRALESEVNAGA